jgi:multiple sugar transport system permease protein
MTVATSTTTSAAARTKTGQTKRRVTTFISYVILFALAAMFLYPFLYATLTSFKPLPEIAADPSHLWPETWTTEAYQALRGLNVPRWGFNSALIAVTVTLATVAFASLAGYALARVRFPGSKAVFTGIIGTMMVPGIVLLIPMFMVLKFLGLVDTYGGLILPKLITAYGIFLMTQFFKSIPTELEEAARIDGANVFQTFSRVVLPLAQASLVALTIATFQGSWNEFQHPLIVITVNNNLYTLPLGLALLRGNMGQNLQWNVLMAASMLTTLPMALIFLFFQRYFIQGVSYGGVKE